MPSFFIRNCRVERFIPNRAAAPLGPPTAQFDLSHIPQNVGSFGRLFEVVLDKTFTTHPYRIESIGRK